MASSTGVVDMVDRNRGSRNALGRSIGAQVLWIPWVESDTTSGMGMSNWPGLPQFEFSLGTGHGNCGTYQRIRMFSNMADKTCQDELYR